MPDPQIKDQLPSEVDWGSLFSWSPKNYKTLAVQWMPSLLMIVVFDGLGTYFLAFIMVSALPVQIMKIRRNKAAAMQEQAEEKENA